MIDVRMVCRCCGNIRHIPIREAVHRTPRCCLGPEMWFAGEEKPDRWGHTRERGSMVDPAKPDHNMSADGLCAVMARPVNPGWRGTRNGSYNHRRTHYPKEA